MNVFFRTHYNIVTSQDETGFVFPFTTYYMYLLVEQNDTTDEKKNRVKRFGFDEFCLFGFFFFFGN